MPRIVILHIVMVHNNATQMGTIHGLYLAL